MPFAEVWGWPYSHCQLDHDHGETVKRQTKGQSPLSRPHPGSGSGPSQLVPALGRVGLVQAVHYMCFYSALQLQVLFASGTTTLYFSYMYSELQVQIKCITWTSAVQYSELDTTLQCTTSQNCAIYIAMQRYWQRSVILSNIVTVRIRHGLTILGL